MKGLEAIKVEPKNGSESFSNKGQNLDFNLSDFWSWSLSDLLNNAMRGVLAEYIVRQDLGIEKSTRTEWDAYDLEMENGIKIEVKSGAYLQSWKQEKLSQISFGIAPTKGCRVFAPKSRRVAALTTTRKLPLLSDVPAATTMAPPPEMP